MSFYMKARFSRAETIANGEVLCDFYLSDGTRINLPATIEPGQVLIAVPMGTPFAEAETGGRVPYHGSILNICRTADSRRSTVAKRKPSEVLADIVGLRLAMSFGPCSDAERAGDLERFKSLSAEFDAAVVGAVMATKVTVVPTDKKVEAKVTCPPGVRTINPFTGKVNEPDDVGTVTLEQGELPPGWGEGGTPPNNLGAILEVERTSRGSLRVTKIGPAPTTQATDSRVVQCNYESDTTVCNAGARAYLTHGVDVAGHRVQVVARSRSGRWVVIWQDLRDLCNFRFKTLTAADPLASNDLPIARDHWTQEMVDNLNRLTEAQAADEPAIR